MLSEKPWRMDIVLQYLLLVMAGFCGGMLLVAWFTSEHAPIRVPEDYATIIGGTLSFHGVVLALLPWLLREHGAGAGLAFGFSTPRMWRAAGFGLLIGVITLPLIVGLGELSAMIFQLLGMKTELQAPVQMLQKQPGWPLGATIFFAAVIMAPIAEEIVFRGILYPSVKQLGFPRTALWTTSLLFAVIHSNRMTVLPFTVLALLLTYVYERTNNLLSSIVMHSCFNLVNFLRVALLPGA